MQTDKEYMSERSITGLHSESAGEYTLPDYNADVKRVLMINPRVVPTGRFISENSVEFSGAIFYDVVYLDGENNVSHADFSTDYEIAVKIDSDSYEDSYVSTAVSSYNVRLVGPRKFSAKCSLSSDVRISEKLKIEIDGDAFDDHEPEVLCSSANVLSPLFASGGETEHKEELLVLDGAIEDEVSVLLSDVKPGLVSLDADSSGVAVKADMIAVIVYKNADSPVSVKIVRIPYAGRVEREGFDECESLFGSLNVSSLNTEIVPTEDGVSVMLSFAVTPSVRGLKNTSLDLVCDAYLKECGTANEYSDFSYTEHICTESTEADLSWKVSLSELSDGNIVDFAAVNFLARVDNCEIMDNKVLLKGEIRISAIAVENDEEEIENHAGVKMTLPFEEYVNISCQKHDNMRVECHVLVNDEKIEVVDNSANVFCTLSILVTLNSEKKQRCLGASYLSGEEYETDGSVITVYYPDEKESVFEVAKKFHTSVQKVAEDNALAQTVFASLDSPIKNFGYKKILIK